MSHINLDYLKSLDHEVTEVRIFCKDRYALGRGQYTGNVCFGYYDADHYEKLIEDVEVFNQCDKVEAIYTTLHACDPSLLARSANRIEMNAKSGITTSDSDIQFLTVFPIDIDPDRPAKISSSQSELDKAAKAAGKLADIFKDFDIVKACSGNGYHILIPLHRTPTTEDNLERFKRLGNIVAKDIVDKLDGVKGDEKVYNPARVFKLYGTKARKGDDIPERPHRDSRLYTDLSGDISRYSLDALEKLLLPLESKTVETPKHKSNTNSRWNGLQDYLDHHNISYHAPKKTAFGLVFHMQCPFNEAHGEDAYATELNDGSWSWACFHDGCSGNKWPEFKELCIPKTAQYSGSAKTSAPKVENVAETFEPYVEDKDSEVIKFPIDAIEDIHPFWAYHKAFEGKNETCPSYRFAEMLVATGIMIGRSAHLEYEGRPTFPNWWVTLVGGSYFSKKSQSLYNSEVLLRRDETVMIERSLSTPEGMVAMMHNYSDDNSIECPRLMLFIDELRSLYTKARMSSSESLIPKLNESYGCPPDLKVNTKNDSASVEKPEISIMGNLTPQWFDDSITMSDIAGGFVNRFVYFTHEQQEFIPIVQKPDQGLWDLCNNTLKDLCGKVDYSESILWLFDTEVAEKFKEVYIDFNESLLKIEDDVVIEASARLLHHAMKLALTISVFENVAGDNMIHIKAFECAVKIMYYWKKVNVKLFTNMSHNVFTEQESLVLKNINDLGGECTKTELSTKIGRNRMDSKTLTSILHSLDENDVVFVEKKRGGKITRLTK